MAQRARASPPHEHQHPGERHLDWHSPDLVADRVIVKTTADGRVKVEQLGEASWYGTWHHGRPTASGARFDEHALTAAHPTLPLGTRATAGGGRVGRSRIGRSWGGHGVRRGVVREVGGAGAEATQDGARRGNRAVVLPVPPWSAAAGFNVRQKPLDADAMETASPETWSSEQYRSPTKVRNGAVPERTPSRHSIACGAGPNAAIVAS